MMTKDETDAKILACLERIAQSVDDTSRALAALADHIRSLRGDISGLLANKEPVETKVVDQPGRRFVPDGKTTGGGHWERSITMHMDKQVCTAWMREDELLAAQLRSIYHDNEHRNSRSWSIGSYYT